MLGIAGEAIYIYIFARQDEGMQSSLVTSLALHCLLNWGCFLRNPDGNICPFLRRTLASIMNPAAADSNESCCSSRFSPSPCYKFLTKDIKDDTGSDAKKSSLWMAVGGTGGAWVPNHTPWRFMSKVSLEGWKDHKSMCFCALKWCSQAWWDANCKNLRHFLRGDPKVSTPADIWTPGFMALASSGARSCKHGLVKGGLNMFELTSCSCLRLPSATIKDHMPLP